MTKKEAHKIFETFVGWTDPKINWNEYDDYWLTAVDPWDNRLKTYNPNTGFFE